MGWGRMFLLGNIGQQMDLDDQQGELDRMKRQLDSSSARLTGSTQELQRLATENDELKLYVATIFRVLVSKKVVSQEELRDLIHAIDREDGQTDQAFRGDVTSMGDA